MWIFVHHCTPFVSQSCTRSSVFCRAEVALHRTKGVSFLICPHGFSRSFSQLLASDLFRWMTIVDSGFADSQVFFGIDRIVIYGTALDSLSPGCLDPGPVARGTLCVFPQPQHPTLRSSWQATAGDCTARRDWRFEIK